jgi:hypothetical protein
LIVGERSLKGEVPSFIRRRLGPRGVQPALRSTTLHRGFLSVLWNEPIAVYVCLRQTPKTMDSKPGKRNPIGDFLVELGLICLLSILCDLCQRKLSLSGEVPRATLESNQHDLGIQCRLAIEHRSGSLIYKQSCPSTRTRQRLISTSS